MTTSTPSEAEIEAAAKRGISRIIENAFVALRFGQDPTPNEKHLASEAARQICAARPAVSPSIKEARREGLIKDALDHARLTMTGARDYIEHVTKERAMGARQSIDKIDTALALITGATRDD